MSRITNEPCGIKCAVVTRVALIPKPLLEKTPDTAENVNPTGIEYRLYGQSNTSQLFTLFILLSIILQVGEMHITQGCTFAE